MVSEAVTGQALNPHGGGVKPGCLAISLHDETGCNSHMALCSSLPLAHQSPSPQQRMRPTRSIKAVNYRILGLWRLMCLKEICLHVFDRRCLREMLRTGTFSSSTAWRAAGWSTTSDPNKWPPENTERCVAKHARSRKHHGSLSSASGRRHQNLSFGRYLCVAVCPHINWCQERQEHFVHTLLNIHAHTFFTRVMWFLRFVLK